MAHRRRQLWLAKISRISRDPAQLALVHERFPEELELMLDPDRQIDYYGRIWRLSQPQTDRAFVYGKLGFARGARAEEVHYDETLHDWVEEEAPSRQGNFSHYVIHLPSQVVAFEEKGRDLSRQSFINAFGRFLSSRGYEIVLMSDTRSFDVWLDEVDRVTRFYVALKRPNPNWTRRAQQAREIADEISAERLSVEATSENHVNVRGTILEGTAETAARGNGYFKASGFVGTARRFYDSSRQFLGAVIDLSDGDSSESTLEKIRGELLERLPEDDHQDDG